MRLILIPAADGEPIRDLDVEDTLESLQRLVGGYIEASVPFPGRQDVTPMYNELGKHLGLPLNARASALLAPVMFADDFIVGDCILTGYDQVAGRTVDCPLRADDLAVPV